MNAELIKALKEDAEWAHANEWETPITLGDHLDAAADRLEAADKAQGWIPVNERLPEIFKNVLCLFPYKNYGSQIEVSYFESNSGVCADAHRYNAPTHWMPLPEPPRKDDEA